MEMPTTKSEAEGGVEWTSIVIGPSCWWLILSSPESMPPI